MAKLTQWSIMMHALVVLGHLFPHNSRSPIWCLWFEINVLYCAKYVSIPHTFPIKVIILCFTSSWLSQQAKPEIPVSYLPFTLICMYVDLRLLCGFVVCQQVTMKYSFAQSIRLKHIVFLFMDSFWRLARIILILGFNHALIIYCYGKIYFIIYITFDNLRPDEMISSCWRPFRGWV